MLCYELMQWSSIYISYSEIKWNGASLNKCYRKYLVASYKSSYTTTMIIEDM
jgi:hypothetical protein